MTDNSPKPNLQKLYRERDSKFDEIVSCLSREPYSSAGPLSEADRVRLIEKAEELTDNWAAAEYSHRSHEPGTALQHLLSEHQLICKAIIDILDAES
jgi:hypothetical protein